MAFYLFDHRAEQLGDCPSGLQWYVCKKNNFNGCCSQDPCDLPTCPDESTTREITVATTPTSTVDETTTLRTLGTLPHSSSVDETTSLTVTPFLRHSSSITFTTTADTETTTGTADTTSTSFITTSSDTTRGPTTTTQTLPPLPTPANPSQGEGGKNGLSKAAIVGISVGIAAAIIVGVLSYLFIRRRRIAKRMSSTPNSSPRREGEKSLIDLTPASPQSPGNGGDVFAPFGGRSNSCATQPPSYRTRDVRKGEAQPLRQSNLNSTDTYEVSPVSPEMNLPDTPQLDSRPVYIELDSTEAPRDGRKSSSPADPVSPMSTTRSSQGERTSLSHPIPLTPGYPGTQMSIQSQLESANMGHRDARQSLSSSQPNFPRATLKATPAERQNNQHVMSWSQL
ncbi:hypothetical protein F4779DRAFT_507221 [Xylariaceae sp. FL0662B]|nr:hypothetical protein F4779DRAFT_507221 [Xylariaceae sp. FL0662B]